MPASFLSLGVSPPLAERLARRGIADPFPIQAATMPDALAGLDVCGQAPTGSGKTLAFGIPLVERVSRARPGRPRGLVLVPTRELATQVRDELVLLAGRKGPSVATFFGGVGFGAQLASLRRGVDIAVACPGRLADLVGRRDVDLGEVEMVVLDEADRMADMGFLPEVRRLLDLVRPDRQTLLFSATLDGDIDVLIRRYQRRPSRHQLAADVNESRNEHLFWQAARDERVRLIAAIIAEHGPGIVFCRTKRGADRVARALVQVGQSAAAIHGNRSQNQREAALAAFAGGRVQALVATDLAARGIHVDDVGCVVHADPPADEKDFVHRSGRTGRAGQAGLVVCLVGPDQVAEIKRMQRRLGLPVGVAAAGIAPAEPGDVRDDRAVAPSSPHPPRQATQPGLDRPRRSRRPGRAQRPAGDRGQPRRAARAAQPSPGETRGDAPASSGRRRSSGATPGPAGRRARHAGAKQARTGGDARAEGQRQSRSSPSAPSAKRRRKPAASRQRSG